MTSRFVGAFVFASLLSFAPFAKAAVGPWGVGLMLFGPTGISATYRMEPSHSIDFAAAWKSHPGAELYVHSTYLWRFPETYRFEGRPMLVYAGLGGRALTEVKESRNPDSGRTFVGVRSAVGTSLQMSQVPIEFFGEGALTMDLAPSTILSFSLGVGGRFFF